MGNSRFRILLVEDEENLALSLKYNLEEDDYDVALAADGEEAVRTFSDKEYDLILLDIGLPKIDGFEVLKDIRSKSMRIPVLVLTARTSASDRVLGLELGADDYLTKPFHIAELMLRIKGMLRRKMWYEEEPTEISAFMFGSNIIDLKKLSARSGKTDIPLTSLEASLLSYFIRNHDKLISKEDILVNVWNIDSKTETRTVENFIVRLRKYFEPHPAKPIFFRTVRGEGYMFTPQGKKL
jgi:DNA-binding response OmpR family regulator